MKRKKSVLDLIYPRRCADCTIIAGEGYETKYLVDDPRDNGQMVCPRCAEYLKRRIEKDASPP